jgi:YVTN family beta-propeller protein
MRKTLSKSNLYLLVVLGITLFSTIGLKAGSQKLKNEVIDVIHGLYFIDGVAVSADSKYIYVSHNHSLLAVINATTHQIIDNAINAGLGALKVALSPNGETVYVAGQKGALGFDTSDLFQTKRLAGDESNSVALSPNGKTAYLVQNGADQVSVFDTAGKGKFVKSIPVGKFPFDAAFTPDGKTVYVTNGGGATISVIDAETNSLKETINTGYFVPRGITITPNGKTAYVLLPDTGVGVIDTETNTVSPSIDLSDYGQGDSFFMAITPDGKYLYVPLPNYNPKKGSLVVIDTATNTVVDSTRIEDSPIAVAISPDGKYAYVTGNASVTVVAISGD